MGPEEILNALDEAIVKVQTNVQTFEKSCSEISEQTTFINGIYAEKTSDLLETLQGFEPDVQELSNFVMSEVIDRAEDAKEEVGSLLGDLEDQLEDQIGNVLNGLTETYNTTYEGAMSFIDETVSRIESAEGEFESIGQDYNEVLGNSLEKLGAIESQVKEQLDAFIQTVSSDLQSAHSDVLDEVNSFMDSSINSELVSFFDSSDSELSGLGDELIDGLGNAGEILSGKFEELGAELIDYADNRATEEVKDIVNGMIDAIIGELAETITEAIIKSSVGVSVTSATSPMMPVLVGFNKIFDALDGAISAWKALKDTFGL